MPLPGAVPLGHALGPALLRRLDGVQVVLPRPAGPLVPRPRVQAMGPRPPVVHAWAAPARQDPVPVGTTEVKVVRAVPALRAADVARPLPVDGPTEVPVAVAGPLPLPPRLPAAAVIRRNEQAPRVPPPAVPGPLPVPGLEAARLVAAVPPLPRAPVLQVPALPAWLDPLAARALAAALPVGRSAVVWAVHVLGAAPVDGPTEVAAPVPAAAPLPGLLAAADGRPHALVAPLRPVRPMPTARVPTLAIPRRPTVLHVPALPAWPHPVPVKATVVVTLGPTVAGPAGDVVGAAPVDGPTELPLAVPRPLAVAPPGLVPTLIPKDARLAGPAVVPPRAIQVVLGTRLHPFAVLARPSMLHVPALPAWQDPVPVGATVGVGVRPKVATWAVHVAGPTAVDGATVVPVQDAGPLTTAGLPRLLRPGRQARRHVPLAVAASPALVPLQLPGQEATRVLGAVPLAGPPVLQEEATGQHLVAARTVAGPVVAGATATVRAVHGPVPLPVHATTKVAALGPVPVPRRPVAIGGDARQGPEGTAEAAAATLVRLAVPPLEAARSLGAVPLAGAAVVHVPATPAWLHPVAVGAAVEVGAGAVPAVRAVHVAGPAAVDGSIVLPMPLLGPVPVGRVVPAAP